MVRDAVAAGAGDHVAVRLQPVLGAREPRSATYVVDDEVDRGYSASALGYGIHTQAATRYSGVADVPLEAELN
jgi:hypothetical protein